MAWKDTEEFEESVVRQHNRVLRIVQRKLRESIRNLNHEMDGVYHAFYETETEAERAMRELWARGNFDCGPQDYDGIVERCVEALQHIAIP